MNPQEAHEQADDANDEGLSQASHVSHVSSVRSHRSQLRMRRAALEAEAVLLDQQQELERQEFLIKQKRKEFEMKQRRAIIDAEDRALEEIENEAPLRMIEGSLPSRASDHENGNHSGGSGVITFKDSKVVDWIRNNERHEEYENFTREALSQLTIQNQVQQRQLLNQNQMQQQQLLNAVHLPAAQLITFDGDPLRYFTFMKLFEANVESITVDNNQRLVRLMQFCTGKAKQVILCCSAMDPEEGYQKAKAMLKQRFGNSHVISDAWITRVTTGQPIRPDDKISLQEFSDELCNCFETLKALDRMNEINCQRTLMKIVEKLPHHLQQRWRKEVRQIRKGRGGEDPNIEDLTTFVKEIADEMNDPVYGTLMSSREQPTYRRENTPNRHLQGPTYMTTMRSEGQRETCSACRGKHTLFECQRFKSWPVEERIKHARMNRLCFNCLKPKHNADTCRLIRKCSVPGCGQKHTKFLHVSQWNEGHSQPAANFFGINNNSESALHQAPEGNMIRAGESQWVRLPILPVILRDPVSNSSVSTIALLDSGSTNSFISQQLAQQLHLEATRETLMITTLHEANSTIQTNVVSVEVMNSEGDKKLMLESVYTTKSLPSINSTMETRDVLERWPHLKQAELPNLSKGSIGLLIGQDNPEALKPLEIVDGGVNAPYAVKTLLGWTLNGPLSAGSDESHHAISNLILNDMNLSRQVERMFELESVEPRKVMLSDNDKKAVDIWNKSIAYKDGHFEVGIPFKWKPPTLPNDKEMAKRRLEGLRSRLLRQPELHQKYADCMNSLFNSGYAEAATDEGMVGSTWYVPHHAVYNVNKPDKIRVVFDCSAEHDHVSLNSQVLQGPDLTNNLAGVLIRFRKEEIAFMADIEAMFHQVRVTEADRDALRFLWWPDGDLDREPAKYRMNVHLFGGIWSPSCCNFVLRHTAESFSKEFGNDAAEIVHHNFYVDDCLKSLPSVEAAIDVIPRLSKMLSRGGFRLNKWICNDPRVIATIPERDRASRTRNLDLDSESIPMERALGVIWDTDEDVLRFTATVKKKPETRRGILSVVSSIYDPLGLISPFILPAKRIIQELCRARSSWDDKLSGTILESWRAWMEDLPSLNQLKINRCLKPHFAGQIVHSQLHHFADASQVGYGTASYLRQADSDGRVFCSLVFAKSRVPPMKILTIPRLELAAAALAIKVDTFLKTEMQMNMEPSVFWTDSTVVLQYIENEERQFHTFVANRVSFIRERSEVQQWRHIATQLNPADDVSRGLRAADLLDNKRWFNGPEFLYNAPESWPNKRRWNSPLSENDPEVKKVKLIYAVVETGPDIMKRILMRYSSWYRLKKAVGWLLRARENLRRLANKTTRIDMKEGIRYEELQRAELEIVKYVQRLAYPELFNTKVQRNLDEGRMEVSKNSAIQRLEPIMLDDGVIRVGGRLQHHPMILPRDSEVTKLVGRHFHEVSGHSGREHVLALTRQRFWIVGGRNVIRSVLKECKMCQLCFPKTLNQRMADLPDDRTAAELPPFSHVGVDMFGPFLVKQGRSMVKRYGCLFTCLVVRAIHIEVTHSLETDSFLQALQRFVCRRGQVRIIRSDNGTNFTGAEKELRETIKKWNQDEIRDFLQQKEIQWHFNPPAASHMGGVWERQIRSVRKILSVLLRQQVLNDENLATLMCMAEAIVNGRPITTVSDDPSDLEPLTPNHLLLLQSNVPLNAYETQKQDLYSRRRWRQVQYLADIFWKRWVREYLPIIQLRQKWINPLRNLEVGDVVVLVDDNIPRGAWPLGRVVETYPGADGLVRSAQLLTKSGRLTRPVHKMCLLESVIE